MGDFVGHLRGLGKRRFTLDELRTAHLAAFPEVADAPAPRRLLLEALEAARAAGHIVLPHARYWERTGMPHLPKSATLCVEGLAATPAPRPVAWVPELVAFAGSERGRRRTTLAAINRFLLGHRNTALREVPVNERSLQIFGNEKRLESYLDADGTTLFDGRIPIGLIGCRPVTPPLAFEIPDRPAPGMPVLVLENLHPWESFRLWNARQGTYAAIACGYGNAVRKTHRQLEQVTELTGASGLLYLGDLDPTGLEIPTAVNRERRARGLAPLDPHCGLYRWLLRHGRRRRSDTGAKHRAPPDLADWLPGDIAAGLAELWAAGEMIPQESFGTEQLAGSDAGWALPGRAAPS